jgi:hypothetical protein
MITKRAILRLIHLSLIAVLFDGIIGLDIFINTTFRFAFILSIIWIAKLVLVTSLVGVGIRNLLASKLFFIIIFLALVNTIRALLDINSIGGFFSGIFFYLLIFFGICAGGAWSKLTNKGEKIVLSNRITNSSVILLFIVCLIYFLLYITNYIDYFGLGVQTYIVVAAILAQKNGKMLLILPVIATIMTGKRGLLIVTLAQYGERISSWRVQHGRIAFVLLITSLSNSESLGILLL